MTTVVTRLAHVRYEDDWPWPGRPWPWCPHAGYERMDGTVESAAPHDTHMVNEGNTTCPGVSGPIEVPAEEVPTVDGQTRVQIAALIGRSALLHSRNLIIEVEIRDVQLMFTGVHYLVTPVAGSGRQWVSNEHISDISPNRREIVHDDAEGDAGVHNTVEA